MPPFRGGICMGADQRNHPFPPGLPPGRSWCSFFLPKSTITFLSSPAEEISNTHDLSTGCSLAGGLMGGQPLGRARLGRREVLEFSQLARPCHRMRSNPEANGWSPHTMPMQMPPRTGGIYGRLTYDFPATRLQGGFAAAGAFLARIPKTNAVGIHSHG